MRSTRRVWLLLVAMAGLAHADRHVVQRGETLGHVAAGHGCTMEAVQRANHLTTSLVRPGTTLEIPSCTITSRARARSLANHAPVDGGATRAITAASSDTDKARRALAVIDGATWIDPPRVQQPDQVRGGRERDRVARDDESAASLDPPKHQHAASIGAPWDGRLEHAAHLDPGDGYDVRRPARAFGADHVVAHLRHVIAEVRALYPEVHTLAIGDLSAQHGGVISEHRSHQSGLDVDVGFYFHHIPAKYPSQFAPADADLDIEATWALLMAFARTADRDDGVAMIFLDYAVQRRLYEWAKRRGTPETELEFLFQYPRGADTLAGLVRHWPAHANHFHVRFKP